MTGGQDKIINFIRNYLLDKILFFVGFFFHSINLTTHFYFLILFYGNIGVKFGRRLNSHLKRIYSICYVLDVRKGSLFHYQIFLTFYNQCVQGRPNYQSFWYIDLTRLLCWHCSSKMIDVLWCKKLGVRLPICQV